MRLTVSDGDGGVDEVVRTVEVASAVPAPGADSAGRDFWLMFNKNLLPLPALTLFITGAEQTSGLVEVPGITFEASFDVVPGTVTSVTLPVAAQTDGYDMRAPLGIHVTAGADVTVYGLNRVQYTTDAFLGLPTDVLGTNYVAASYPDCSGSATRDCRDGE